jgi:hypothetical protein
MARKYLGSGVTNSNGVASFNYTGKGLGKIQVVAESGELVSTSYDLYDVLFKDMGTSTDYSNWNPSSQIDSTIVRDSNCTTLTPLDPTVFGARTVNTNGATVVEFDAKVNVLGNWISLRQGTQTSTSITWQYLGYTVDEWTHYKIEADGINYRATVNDSVKEWRQMVNSQTYNRFQFSFNENTGLIIKYKNFIMY